MPGLATTEDLNRLRSEEGGELDRDFLQLMIWHHQTALPMARFAGANARVAQVHNLAAEIAFEQSGELERMTQLLLARG